MGSLLRRLRYLVARGRHDAELREEIDAHRALRQAQLERDGLAATEAASASRRALGNLSLAREDAHAVWLGAHAESAWQDVRFTLRSLGRSPGFTGVAVLTLAVGLGAATTIFSVVYTVLLHPLPYPDADRIVQVSERGSQGQEMMPSDPNFDDLAAGNHSLAAFAQYDGDEEAVVVDGEATLSRVAGVSAGFFDVMGVQPLMGRAFLPAERHFGAAPLAIVSAAFWRAHLHANPDLSGATIRVLDKICSVVGVMPASFDFPAESDIWLSSEQWRTGETGRTGRNSYAIGRLSPGTSIMGARADLGAIARRLKQQYGNGTSMVDAAVTGLQDEIVGDVRPVLLMLAGAVAFLLVMVCANVLNLLLVRMAARDRELRLRAALGAGRWRVVRQIVTETSVLASVAGALGSAIAVWCTSSIRAFAPDRLPRIAQLHVGWPVMLFALGIAAVVSLVVGGVTAARTSLAAAWTTIGQERAATPSVSSRRMRAGLVTAQIATVVVLLAGTGLLARSLVRLIDTNPGYRVAGIVEVQLHQAPIPDASIFDSPGAADPARARQAEFIDNLAQRLHALPQVTDVGAVDVAPLAGDNNSGEFVILQNADEAAGLVSAMANRHMEVLEHFFDDNAARSGYAGHRAATEGFFRALGIPLVRGRLFDTGDTVNAPHVAVISASLAKTRWPGSDPIGRQIEFGNMDGDLRPLTIVGVVGDVRDEGLDTTPRPIVYTCLRQRPSPIWSLLLHTSGPTAAIAAPTRAIVHSIGPDVPVRMTTIADRVSTWLAWRQFVFFVLVVFGAAALVIATLGLYGSLSYAVTQQTREIGVRLALGAAPAAMRRMVLGRAAPVTAAGMAIGLALAAAFARSVTTLLYQIRPTDLVTSAAIVAVVGLGAFAASWLPARRASRVDPAEALRAE